MGKLLGNAGIADGAGGPVHDRRLRGRRLLRLRRCGFTRGSSCAFGVFLLLAILLYGSLFMAVGAACNELKDAQSL